MANIPISSFTAAANATGIGMSGFSLTGSNAQSMLDLAGTWNTSGTPTGIKLNVTDTASNAASLLMDLQVGGVSRLNVDKNGRALSPLNSNSIPALATSAASDRGFGFYANRPSVLYGTNVAWSWPDAQTMSLGSTSRIAWTSGNPIDATGDLFILRDAANTLAQRNGTNAQTLRVYNTFTDASNYERGVMAWISNDLKIGVENAGTGASNRQLHLYSGGILRFYTNNVHRWNVDASGNFVAATDNTVDIGASGANRPRNIFAAGDIYTQSNTTGFFLGASADVALLRDDPNVLAQRRSTNAQTFRIYNTFTDASNYERGFVRWTTNILQIGSEAAGTGSNRSVAIFAGTTVYNFNTNEIAIFPAAGGLEFTGRMRISSPALGIARFTEHNGSNAGALELPEWATAPAAPAANNVRIYAEDNGSGKTRLMARFATGAAVQIAIEP